MLNQLNQEVGNVVRNRVCVFGEWQENINPADPRETEISNFFS